jgi:UDP-glucose 4-epimerase
MINNLLVTGGLGFIGSHTVVDIYQRTKANIVIIDDLSNCCDDVLERIKKILAMKSTKEEIESRL